MKTHHNKQKKQRVQSPRSRSQAKRRRGKAERASAKGAETSRVMLGELSLHRDGYGFVVSARGEMEDLFLPARFVGDALHGDTVEVKLASGRQGKREGRIVRIISRGMKQLIGRMEVLRGVAQVIADDRRVRRRIFVDTQKLAGASHGDTVLVRITRYPQGNVPMQGEVIKVLGPRGMEATEKETVILRHQLERDFRPAVLEEAEAIAASLTPDALEGREDLRALPFVTIDGETAQDFDDAVAVKRLDQGIIRLWVSIADVSFFVRPQSALDRAAYERGTSVYFPGDCLPMLPKRLSNDLCSLMPDQDRFTFTAELDVGTDGSIVRERFYRSVIRSQRRLTYTAVKQVLVLKDAEALETYHDQVLHLKLMRECYDRLRQERMRRGSIDFDLPEPEIVLDLRGDIEDIVRADRHVGHMIIEECMIAANEAVARRLEQSSLGCIFRIHEPPPAEKIQGFEELLHNLGYQVRLGRDVPSRKLAKIIAMVQGKPEERLVNHALLRSMSQAVYSAENKGHYGLVSKCYCHFTSPIRRYPDLVVHRLLQAALQEGGARGANASKRRRMGGGSTKAGKPQQERLQEVAEHCSRRERVSMEAEREMAKLYAALFLQQRIGEEFEGIISHVTKFGFFVELLDYFVEGLVHIASLGDESYRFVEEKQGIYGKRSQRALRVGEKVRISVEEVDLQNREIFFELV